jgi:protein SCO1
MAEIQNSAARGGAARGRLAWLALLCGLLGISGTAPATSTELLQRIGFDQHIGAPLPESLAFRDEDGRPVAVGNYLGGKPAILAMTYYRCPNLCTLVLNGLVDSLKSVQLTAGKDFSVVAVSIDPRETPALAAEKRASYQKHAGGLSGWHFLTDAGGSAARLAGALGFRYAYDKDLDEYAHPAGVAVITPEGRISRYFFGVKFAPEELRLGLVEASNHRLGSLTDHLWLLCYRYDPASGKYGFAIMGALRVAAAAFALFLVGYVLVMVRREQRGSRR